MSRLIAASLVTLVFAQETKVDDRTDLEKYTFGRCYFGTPVAPVDLQGKVVVLRNWAG